jgi:AcrR family transcriptional regulator
MHRVSGRKLRLRARAERMAETRQRIVRATYELHRDMGPARTTISAIAERAGVQRLTVYHHFHDELELAGACTVYGLALDPLPDPVLLGRIPRPEDRLRAALAEQYAYYARNESLIANALRDLPIVQERMRAAGATESDVPEAVRAFYSQPDRMREVLVGGWRGSDSPHPHLDAVLGLALAFSTWRTLVRERGLEDSAAVDLMVQAVACAAVLGAPHGSDH